MTDTTRKTSKTSKTDTTNPTDDTTSAYLNNPMYLASLAQDEIRELAYQIDKLADRYDFKAGVEARMVTELLKVAGHVMGRVSFSDLHAVEKANPAKDAGK